MRVDEFMLCWAGRNYDGGFLEVHTIDKMRRRHHHFAAAHIAVYASRVYHRANGHRARRASLPVGSRGQT
jgi:hypothetical protein